MISTKSVHVLLHGRIQCVYGSLWKSLGNIHVLSGIRTYNHCTEGPPGLALTLMAVEVRILGKQHETLVMELDSKWAPGSVVCYVGQAAATSMR
jgi:hypothetical protein